MTAKKKDTWSSLASMLGLGGSSAPEPQSPAETAPVEPAAMEASPIEQTTAESNHPADVIEPAPTTVEVASCLKVEDLLNTTPVNAAVQATPPAAAPKRRDRWDSLLGQLGLATPEPVAEVIPEPEPPPKFTSKKNVSRTPFLKTPPVREPAAKTPPPAAPPAAPVVAPSAPVELPVALDEEAAEGPPGYQGPDLMQRLEAEREVERQKIANQRSTFDKLFQPGGKRSTKDDEVNYDDDLNSGLKALWDDHDSQAATARELPKAEEPRRDEPRREEPKREFPRREEGRRTEPRREEGRRDEPRREEPRREVARRDDSRRDEPKREFPRREEPRREEPRRDEPKREVARRDEPRRDEPRRDEINREEPRRERSRRDEFRDELKDLLRDKPVDEKPAEIDDIEADSILDAPRENLAGDEADFQPRKRRRRRRGRRRGGSDRESVDAAATPISEVPRDLEDVDFIDEARDALIVDTDDVDDAPCATSREATRGRDEAGRPPRKRRRRRRPEDSPAVEKVKPLAVDEEFDDEFDGPASLDYMSDEQGEDGHKGIPTWDDAVGAIVTANIEARGNRPNHGGSRGRDGGRDRDGGRGRGGRR